MLVLSRKEGERLTIGENITIVINRVSGNRVTIGIEAPKHVKVVRSELSPQASVSVPMGGEVRETAAIDLQQFIQAASTKRLRQVG